MSSPLPVALIGAGRMGQVHALHLHELQRETGACTLAAIVDPDLERAQTCANAIGTVAPIYPSIDDMLAAGIARASVIATPTDRHRQHAAQLIAAGQRVLLEKPLTGTLEDDRAFAAELDRDHPRS